MKRKLLGFLVILAMALSLLSPAARADEKQLSEEERKKQEAESEAARISGLRDDLLLELSAKRAEADALVDEMVSLNAQITETRDNIDRILQERVTQEADLDEQRAAMAMRIQYSYEQPVTSYLELLLGSCSLSEILNNAEYIRSISEYDTRMKEEYEKTLEESDQNLIRMREEEDRLTSLLADTSAKYDQYQQITEELLRKIDEYNQEAEAYSEEAKILDQEIAEIAERLRREEEAAQKAAELARQQKEAEEEARRQAESLSALEESRRREEESRAAERTEAPTEAPETQPPTEAPTEVPETQPQETEPPETEPPETEPPETEPPETEPPETEPPETSPQETEPPETEPPETEPPESEPPESEPPESEPPESEPPETEPMSEWQRRYLIASDERGVGTLDIDPNWLNPSGYTNLEFLAAIIDVEGGGQPYEGRVAIGNIIMNRILEPGFQMTIYDVVYGPGQFPPATNGMLDLCLARGARESCVEAARDVLNGVCTIERKWLYFCSITSWEIKQPRHTEFMQIGTHIFYY